MYWLCSMEEESLQISKCLWIVQFLAWYIFLLFVKRTGIHSLAECFYFKIVGSGICFSGDLWASATYLWASDSSRKTGEPKDTLCCYGYRVTLNQKDWDWQQDPDVKLFTIFLQVLHWSVRTPSHCYPMAVQWPM